MKKVPVQCLLTVQGPFSGESAPDPAGMLIQDSSQVVGDSTLSWAPSQESHNGSEEQGTWLSL
jgi:hypothetical protein